MSNFLEQYGKAIFVLVLMAILIAFAGPLGIKIKEYTLAKAEQTTQIGTEEIKNTNRLPEPENANDSVYAILDTSGELSIMRTEEKYNQLKQEKTIETNGDYGKVVLNTTDCPKWTDTTNGNSNIKAVNIIEAIKPTSCYRFFNKCTNLVEIKNIQNLYTNECTNMVYMFNYCTSLTSLDVSYFDTSKVTNMTAMFQVCESLKVLDVSYFDTSNVIDMQNIFAFSNALTSINGLENFNTSHVTNMSQMFAACTALTSLDVSHFDTSHVTNMRGMFYSCTALTSLDVNNFNTSNVINMSVMFSGCRGLSTIKGFENFDTSNVTNMSSMFSNGENYTGSGKLRNLKISNWDTHNVTDMTGMFYGQGTQTNLDVSNWNVSNCTSFNHMFCDNFSLQSLDLSKWNTKNVKTMYNMFDDCRSLKTIGNVSNWNLQNCIDVGGWLNGCTTFEGTNGTLDISHWNTPNLLACGEMFRGINGLHTIKMNQFNTKNVIDGKWTGCDSGIYYAYGNDTDTMKGMSVMFKDCPNLTSIQVGSNWITDGKTTTDMFLNCGVNHVTKN